MGILGKHPGVGGQRGQREHSFATVSEAPIVMSNGNAPVGDPPRRLLIVGSTPGPYGGLEAFMITVAEAAQTWPGFEVRMCFKLVRGTEAQDSLRAAFAKTGIPTAVVRSGSRELLRQIRWAHVLHVQNVPPDVIAYAWVLAHPSRPSVVTGSARVERIARAKRAESVALSHAEWYELLEAARGREVA